MTPSNSAGPKIGGRWKQLAIIFHECRVIVNFVPKFVAMATGVGRGKILKTSSESPDPKISNYYLFKNLKNLLGCVGNLNNKWLKSAVEPGWRTDIKRLIISYTGFSVDLNFQDVMTSKLKKLDVSVQNLEVMQYKPTRKIKQKPNAKQDLLHMRH